MGSGLRWSARLPRRWDYGRPTELRDLFARESKQYLLEVCADAKVRLVRGGDWTRADQWAAQLPRSAWQSFTVRDAEKGPITTELVLLPPEAAAS